MHKNEYDHSSTIKKYNDSINEFFKNAKDNCIKNVETNKNKIVENIKDIFDKFNDSITGFQTNIEQLKEYLDDIENFIFKQTGAKGTQ